MNKPEAKQDCNVAIRNITYIKNLVNETLKIAELTSPMVELEKKVLSLDKLLKEIIINTQITFDIKKIEVKNRINKPIIISVDKITNQSVVVSNKAPIFVFCLVILAERPSNASLIAIAPNNKIAISILL